MNEEEHRHMETCNMLAQIHQELREINSRVIEMEKYTGTTASFILYGFVLAAIVVLAHWLG